MRAEIEGRLTDMFRTAPAVAALLPGLEGKVARGDTPPDAAAAEALAAFRDALHRGDASC
jgi:LAO/AO transport system kinase